MVLAVNEAGKRVARVCGCQQSARQEHRVAAARIPKRYQDCILDSFDVEFPGADSSLAKALHTARGFVHSYPVGTNSSGLLLTGSLGTGKTHLAVGILLALMEVRGVQGLFCDYRELLKEIQHSWNPQVNSTELDVLKPIFEAEVLVLDELGAQKPTDWVWDTVALILNSRYNDKLTTIITTNYPNRPAGATKEETLGDRVGDRMFSRLAQMCVPVEMAGKDFRHGVKRAAFS